MAGQLELGELAAVIQRASLLIANNTGPVHVAAAIGTPVVDLYALTNPQHTPWRVLSRVLFHDVPCRYCYKSVCPEQHHACLRQVSPEAVAHAALELLDTVAQRRDNVLPLRRRRPVPAHRRSMVRV
jgi:ADP-heptose:LPS heptosyltransferase